MSCEYFKICQGQTCKFCSKRIRNTQNMLHPSVNSIANFLNCVYASNIHVSKHIHANVQLTLLVSSRVVCLCSFLHILSWANVLRAGSQKVFGLALSNTSLFLWNPKERLILLLQWTIITQLLMTLRKRERH